MDLVQSHDPVAATDGNLEHGLVGTRRSKGRGIGTGRFDMDATPALLVKSQAYRRDDWVLCADVDVEAFIDVPQGSR